jgi:hypothetical protein
MSVALVLNVLAFLGMQLVWFEGDQTLAQLPFFQLLVATVLLTTSFALGGAYTNLLRATGTFFLLLNLEICLCLLPPKLSSGASQNLWNSERKDTAYAGGVLVLIAVLASLVAAFTNGFAAPAAGAASRIASLRGLAFILAAVFLLIASAVQWSWTEQCYEANRPSPSIYAPTNGVLVVVGFIFLIAILYGDNDTVNLSVFLAATYLLLSGFADPIFDSNVDWPGQSNFKNKWKAAKGLSFIGAVLLLLSVWLTGERGKPNPAALPFDIAAFAIAFAGAVCVFVRSNSMTLPSVSYRTQPHVDYAAAYAIVITVINLLQGVLGLDAGQYISTFFAAVVLADFDLGSLNGTTGYLRGGLQLCQLGVLLSVFLKAFPAGQPLASYWNSGNTAAVGFGLSWGLLAMLKVPSNYSICVLLAIITYKAISSGSADWGRTAFYILSLFGVAASFPLRAAPVQTQFFAATAFNDYINTLAWLTSVYFVVIVGSAGAPAAAAAAAADAAAPNEPVEEKVTTVTTTTD